MRAQRISSGQFEYRMQLSADLDPASQRGATLDLRDEAQRFEQPAGSLRARRRRHQRPRAHVAASDPAVALSVTEDLVKVAARAAFPFNAELRL